MTNNLPNIFADYLALFGNPFWAWLGMAAGIVLLLFIISALLRKVVAWLVHLTEKSDTEWDDVVVGSLQPSITILVWVVGISYAVEFVVLAVNGTSSELMPSLRKLATIGCLLWFVMLFLKASENIVHKRKQMKHGGFDEAGLSMLYKIMRVITLVVATLLISSNLGFSLSGILAFGGLGGIAIGFAAKDLLSNFFGGLMIYLDRPFSEGDWIRSPDREIEGTVEKIGWRLTRIKTFERRPLYVPNAIFAQITVENASRMESRRFKEIVGVRYNDIEKVSVIVEKIKDLLKHHPKVDDRRLLIVALDAFDVSSVNILVYSYIKETQGSLFYDSKQEILLTISDIIAAHGAEIAFPTQTLHIASVSPSVSSS